MEAARASSVQKEGRAMLQARIWKKVSLQLQRNSPETGTDMVSVATAR